jgi:hypothetical protein
MAAGDRQTEHIFRAAGRFFFIPPRAIENLNLSSKTTRNGIKIMSKIHITRLIFGKRFYFICFLLNIVLGSLSWGIFLREKSRKISGRKKRGEK